MASHKNLCISQESKDRTSAKVKIEQVLSAKDILTLRLLANAACRWLMALIQRACYKD